MLDWKVVAQAVGMVLVAYLLTRIWWEMKLKAKEGETGEKKVRGVCVKSDIPYTPDLGINYRILRADLAEYKELIPKLEEELRQLEGKLKPESDKDIAEVPWASLPEAWQMIVLKRRHLEDVRRAVNDIKGILSSA